MAEIQRQPDVKTRAPEKPAPTTPTDIQRTAQTERAKLRATISYGPSDQFLRENAEKVKQILSDSKEVLRNSGELGTVETALTKPTPENVRKLQELLAGKSLGEEGLIVPSKDSSKRRFDGEIGPKTLLKLSQWIESFLVVSQALKDIPELPKGGASLGDSLNLPSSLSQRETFVESAPLPKEYIATADITIFGNEIKADMKIRMEQKTEHGIWISFIHPTKGEVQMLIDNDMFNKYFVVSASLDSQKTSTIDSPVPVEVLTTIPVLKSSSGGRKPLSLN